MGWTSNQQEIDDGIDLYQIVAGNSPISLELQIITHDGDSDNTTTNSDLDMYVLDTEQNSVSQGASLAKVENAEVPAGAGDIYYIYIDHWTDYNSVPSSYVITTTPALP